MLKKILLFFLLFIMQTTTLFANPMDLNMDMIPDIVDVNTLNQNNITTPELANNHLMNMVMLDTVLNTSMNVDSNDILSTNANSLNNIIDMQSQQILPQDDLSNQIQNNFNTEALNQMMNGLMNNQNQNTIINGYIYKYVEDTKDFVEESEDKSISMLEEDIESNETTNIDTTIETDSTVVNTENTNNEDTNTENIETTDSSTEDSTKTEDLSLKKKKIEYFTMIKDETNNKTYYIELTTENQHIVYLFNLIAEKDILVEIVGKLKTENTLVVSYVTILDTLPEDIKDKLDKYIKDTENIQEDKGVFISLDGKVYFLPEDENNFLTIDTEIKAIEELIFYITDKGFKTKINYKTYDDYVDIFYIELLDNEFTEEEKIILKNIITYDTTKIYNAKSPIFMENNIYYIKVNEEYFVLDTDIESIKELVLDLANTNTTVYLEGYVGRDENLFNIKYITTVF